MHWLWRCLKQCKYKCNTKHCGPLAGTLLVEYSVVLVIYYVTGCLLFAMSICCLSMYTAVTFLVNLILLNYSICYIKVILYYKIKIVL